MDPFVLRTLSEIGTTTLFGFQSFSDEPVVALVDRSLDKRVAETLHLLLLNV